MAVCLKAAQDAGNIPAQLDPQRLGEFFWIAWEGAVLRARLMRSDQPLLHFMEMFLLTTRPSINVASQDTLRTVAGVGEAANS